MMMMNIYVYNSNHDDTNNNNNNNNNDNTTNNNNDNNSNNHNTSIAKPPFTKPPVANSRTQTPSARPPRARAGVGGARGPMRDKESLQNTADLYFDVETKSAVFCKLSIFFNFYVEIKLRSVL